MFANLGAFFTAALEQYSLSKTMTLAALELKDDAQLVTMGTSAAWDRLVKAKGAQG